ncbi:MAG: hypothetical protein HYS13_18310 [Planctomycetia bacterium]|nr:hypothetical protein [Planctomycetia bacterium]
MLLPKKSPSPGDKRCLAGGVIMRRGSCGAKGFWQFLCRDVIELENRRRPAPNLKRLERLSR